MALLDDIIRDATTDEVPLTTVLRRTLILATELKNAALKEWVRRELNGYLDGNEVPDYRVIHTQAQGLMIGPAGMSVNDQVIAEGLLEERHRHWATTAKLMEPASSYEMMLKKDDGDGQFRIPWPGQLVAHYQTKIMRHLVLNRAWLVVSMGALTAIVDVVRTRVLEFALEIREEAGDREDVAAAVSAEVVQEKVVQQIFNGNVVMANTIAGGVHQVGKIVVKGDFGSLAAALQEAGIPEHTVAELKEAIDADEAEGAKAGIGTRVGAWLGERAENLGDNVAGAAVGAAVMAFFGLG